MHQPFHRRSEGLPASEVSLQLHVSGAGADESKPSTGPQVQGPRVPGAQVLGPQDSQDHKSLQDWCRTPVAASEGLLAVYKIGSAVPENTLETHDHDKAEAVQETVHEMIRRACQGPEGEVDDELHTHILTHVRHVATDQCPLVAKSMKMLANDPKLPSVCWVSYDAAHQVRIAFEDPLHAMPEFHAQWDRLFSGKNALVPDIQNSEVWKSRLMACQQAVLEQHGAQGGLTKTMKAFSFAKPRFDSTAGPLF